MTAANKTITPVTTIHHHHDHWGWGGIQKCLSIARWRHKKKTLHNEPQHPLDVGCSDSSNQDHHPGLHDPSPQIIIVAAVLLHILNGDSQAREPNSLKSPFGLENIPSPPRDAFVSAPLLSMPERSFRLVVDHNAAAS